MPKALKSGPKSNKSPNLVTLKVGNNNSSTGNSMQSRFCTSRWCRTSMTRLSDLLHFGQLFKAYGDKNFAKIAHIFRQFFKLSKSFIFLVKSFLGNLYRYLANFLIKCHSHPNAQVPSPQPTACRSPSCSLTTATGSNSIHLATF